MAEEPDAAAMAGMSEATAIMAVSADVAGEAGPAMASTCGSTCLTEVADVCTLAGGVAVTSLVALLMGARRETVMILLAHTRVAASVRRRPRWSMTPWTVLSLSALGVLRV